MDFVWRNLILVTIGTLRVKHTDLVPGASNTLSSFPLAENNTLIFAVITEKLH